MRAFCGVVLCVALLLLLCGCKSQHLVYQSDLDDTWYAVKNAIRHASGSSACNVNDKQHTLSTCKVYCSSEWDNPSPIPNVSSNPDSIRYGSTDSRRDYRSRRVYWYASVQCKAVDSRTEVIVSLHQGVEYYPPRYDTSRDDYYNDSCPEAYEWKDEFFRELNEQLGEPTVVD